MHCTPPPHDDCHSHVCLARLFLIPLLLNLEPPPLYRRPRRCRPAPPCNDDNSKADLRAAPSRQPPWAGGETRGQCRPPRRRKSRAGAGSCDGAGARYSRRRYRLLRQGKCGLLACYGHRCSRHVSLVPQGSTSDVGTAAAAVIPCTAGRAAACTAGPVLLVFVLLTPPIACVPRAVALSCMCCGEAMIKPLNLWSERRLSAAALMHQNYT